MATWQMIQFHTMILFAFLNFKIHLWKIQVDVVLETDDENKSDEDSSFKLNRKRKIKSSPANKMRRIDSSDED